MHTCSQFANPEKVAVLRARANMLVRAERSDDRTKAIISASVQEISDNSKIIPPKMETMKRAIRRVRTGNNIPVPPPANRGFKELIIYCGST